MELHPPLHFYVVAIEKEAFRSPSTKVTNNFIKGKVELSRGRSSTLPYTWSCSYWKGNLQVTFDYDHELYNLVLGRNTWYHITYLY